MKKVYVRKNEYYDSAYLMQIARQLKQLEAIEDCTLMMGSETNKKLLQDAGYQIEEDVTGSDLLIAIDSEHPDAISLVAKEMEKIESQLKKSDDEMEYYPVTLRKAIEMMDDANLVLISVAGEYAAREADIALDAGKHVMVFSDNVSLEDELKLKKKALEKGLLLMGPDCGTAIINGYPLAFANVVDRGKIGIVGASGTGIQEVTSIISRLGGGISQAIGTGGRDLKDKVGGMMMKLALKALQHDSETELIVLISKPPSPKVAQEIIDLARKSPKKVLINFLGILGEDEEVIKYASDLTQTAFRALELGGIEVDKDKLSLPQLDFSFSKDDYFVALYTGGTLAAEFLHLLKGQKNIYSNLSSSDNYLEEYQGTEKFHKVIDLGEDEFTRGRPHPMIDPTLRNEFIVKEANNGAKAIILDFVLGYGSHLDPVGEALPALQEALKINPELKILASITGTPQDPQDYEKQKEKLLTLPNVYYFETNAFLAEELKNSLAREGELENE